MTINLRFIIVRIKWWMVFWYELYGIWWECLKCLNGVTFFLINLIVSNGYLFKNASKDRSVSHLFVPVYLRERGPGPHHNGTAKSRRSVRGHAFANVFLHSFRSFHLFTENKNDAHLIVKNLRLTVKYGNYHSKRTYFMHTKIP